MPSSPMPPTVVAPSRGSANEVMKGRGDSEVYRPSSAFTEGRSSTSFGALTGSASISQLQRLGEHEQSSKFSVLAYCCRYVVEHRIVVGFTTLLTIWVLLGEDLKLILTNKPADPVFGFIGIACIAVFSIEILLSSIGKEDYFLGFFFLLDVISTASLVLDLPWISDAMNSQEEEDSSMVSNAERGRTARIGARSARVVRVIRLVRIAKLYKAVYESRAAARNQSGAAPGKGNPEDDDDQQGGEESRVGKKLSDLTTRRVIVLVLSMLIILPLLSAEGDVKIPTSANFGADEAWLAFQKAGGGNTPSQEVYETTLLRYIYYHNWYSGNSKCPDGKQSPACPSAYASHLYWVGISGAKLETVQRQAEKARLRQATVEDWAANVSAQDNQYNYGDIAPEALPILWSDWASCTASGSSSEKIGISLLSIPIPGVVDFVATCYYDLRPTERTRFSSEAMTFDQYDDFHFDFWFDQRPFVKIEAYFSIATTAFVCVVLCGAAMLFYNDVNQLVLYPVEEMISKVQAIRDNPLKAVQLAESAFAKEVRTDGLTEGELDMATLETRLQQAKRILACYAKQSSEPMETVILEKTIIKLGSLLALGFGEAGAQIIASNMAGSSSGVNVMVPGVRMELVIGHARIQNFSVVTEVLQSRVMTFVNQVAEIVHGVVEEHHGSTNKNNGDTFLLIWRCMVHEDAEEKIRTLSKLCEMSVFAFAKMIGAIHRSPVLAHYRGHPGLQNKLGSKYRVHLSCGAHCGWAIEGAVGSEYKIEASYLSPNVAVAVNVEEATSIYNVSFLASESVVCLCSQGLRNKTRLVDRVWIPGSKEPLQLYCLDLDWNAVVVDESPSPLVNFRARERMRARQLLEVIKKQKPEKNMCDLFDNDADILEMRRGITEDFCELFRMGYQNYAEGEWQVARRFLEETCCMRKALDGPSWALIRYMEKFQFEAPSDWKGVHDLSSALQGTGLGTPGELSAALAMAHGILGFCGGPVLGGRPVLVSRE